MHPIIIVLYLALWAFVSTSARATVNASPGTQAVEVSAARHPAARAGGAGPAGAPMLVRMTLPQSWLQPRRDS